MTQDKYHSNLELIDSLSDEDAIRNALDDPDNPPIDPAFWKAAQKVQWKDRHILLAKKKDIHIKIDEDIYDFFKTQTGGTRGDQTLINAVLREYMQHHSTFSTNNTR